MTRINRAFRRTVQFAAASALVSTLAACVVNQPAVRSGPNPHEVAVDRLHQIDARIDNLSHRIDNRVNQGYYPPPQGGALHHRLDTIRGEAHDMAAQHGGGISGDEQHVLNQELDTAARAIGE
ncbi:MULTISPECIES: hypothetical protein [unclassified Paraburkholderia]|uniref:hypothetical protein n=1 Tax=unclassified Paraburkholderia TaxID=2615204 RepID=UPI00197FC9EA|nr:MULTISPECIES: hypothetical protein [unclassified Paraburkholderia]MBN3854479.1 hypothetical protein [Paraburkholderia sp. Ac-20340]